MVYLWDLFRNVNGCFDMFWLLVYSNVTLSCSKHILKMYFWWLYRMVVATHCWVILLTCGHVRRGSSKSNGSAPACIVSGRWALYGLSVNLVFCFVLCIVKFCFDLLLKIQQRFLLKGWWTSFHVRHAYRHKTLQRPWNFHNYTRSSNRRNGRTCDNAIYNVSTYGI